MLASRQRVPRKQRAKCVLSCPHRRRVRVAGAWIVLALSQRKAESRPGACLHLSTQCGCSSCPLADGMVHSGMNVLLLHVCGAAASPYGVELWLFDAPFLLSTTPISSFVPRTLCSIRCVHEVRFSPCLAAALVCLMRLCLGLLSTPSQWLSPRACPALLCTSSCEWATRSLSERSSGSRGTLLRSRSVPAIMSHFSLV